MTIRDAGPPQGANNAPGGGSAAATAASVGVLIRSPFDVPDTFIPIAGSTFTDSGSDTCS